MNGSNLSFSHRRLGFKTQVVAKNWGSSGVVMKLVDCIFFLSILHLWAECFHTSSVSVERDVNKGTEYQDLQYNPMLVPRR